MDSHGAGITDAGRRLPLSPPDKDLHVLPFETIQCPYCGETIDIAIDDSVDRQQYVEDCQVCCRPIKVVVSVDEGGGIAVQAWAENEA